MENAKKWKKGAVEALSQPIKRTRGLKSVIGRVETTFDEIRAARQRGMPWSDIAVALQHDDNVSVSAVESAYKRLCREKGVNSTSLRNSRQVSRKSVKDAGAKHNEPNAGLFDSQRWVDDGE